MSNLNERLQGYREEPWWPSFLSWSPSPECWMNRGRYLDSRDAHALIGWSLLVWMVDRKRVTLRGHSESPELLKDQSYVAGYGPKYWLENEYDVHADTPLDALLSCYDAIKKGASDGQSNDKLTDR